jgi:membrane protease subunit HflK
LERIPALHTPAALAQLQEASLSDWQYRQPTEEGPDPAEVIRMVRRGAARASRSLGLGALIAVGGFLAYSSYYQVEPDEVGVVRRLGRYSGTSDPGPHFKLPLIDSVTKVPVQRQLKMEFGFRSKSVPGDRPSKGRQMGPGSRTAYEASDRELVRESLMLTGDLNVAVVDWIVQYKIKDPFKYLFKVRNVEDTLRSLSEAAMRAVVGDHSVNEVLTTGRQAVATKSKEFLQQFAERYECGVDIQQVVLQDVNPPDPVKPSFNEVNQAIQEKERAINESQAELNKEIPRARGEAEQAVRAAEGYAIERINRARGETERFLAIYEEYKKAPEITRRRMYLETMAKALPLVGNKVIVDDTAKNLTPILKMDPAPVALSAAAASRGEP